jgi:predicted enzyme related to lactoylglutathione lyase
MSKDSGKFVWYELMTSDLEAAESFYRKVLGWNIQDAGMGGFSYRILSVGTTGIGGLMEIPEEARAMGAGPCWMGYVGVDNVDEAAQRLRAAGGQLCKPAEDIPGVGRFAVVADAQGAVFLLFRGSGDQSMPVPAPGTPGTVGWHELHAVDGPTAFDFYAGQFGWAKAEAIDMGPLGKYQIFTIGGQPAGGMMTKPADAPTPGWLYYFNTDALDAAVARVKEARGTIVLGPQQVPGGSWIVNCLDPQGALFALVAPKR